MGLLSCLPNETNPPGGRGARCVGAWWAWHTYHRKQVKRPFDAVQFHHFAWLAKLLSLARSLSTWAERMNECLTKMNTFKRLPWLLLTCCFGFTNLNICILSLCFVFLFWFWHKNTSFLLKFQTKRLTEIYWIATHRTRVSEKPNANTNKRILRFMQMLCQQQQLNNNNILLLFFGIAYSHTRYTTVCRLLLNIYAK